MVGLARDVLGLELVADEPGMAVFDLPNGDAFEIFGPGHHGGGHPASGVVAGFLVDDVRAARAELEASGNEVTEVTTGHTFEWVHFRAPDGNVYELLSGPHPDLAANGPDGR